MCMAITAVGVDAVLPAFPDIRDSLGLAEGATSVTALITVYLMGSSLGLLPAGVLSDRFGRRAVMWGGLVLYVIGAVGSVFAPTLATMIAARFVWGLGSAGPRVAAMAMVRDAYEGDQMARMMSFVMAIFILVPTFAPALSTGVLAIGPWQLIFWGCAGLAFVVAAMVIRLPETLPVESRRSLAAREVIGSCRAVLSTPGTGWYLVSLTALFGVFMAYLSSSEVIIDQVFDLEAWFPLVFGGIALVMGASMVLNGRIVERVGLHRILYVSFLASLATTAALLVVSIVTSGSPPFALFVVMLAAVLFVQQMLIPNMNSAAMQPLGHVAGTGTAILGMVSGVLGAVIGEVINRQFNGGVTPLAIGFLVSAVIAWVAWLRAESTSLPSLATATR